MRILFCLVLCMFFAGCKTMKDASLDSWVGKSMKSVENRMGNADEVLHMRNGHTMYVYMSEIEDYSANVDTLNFMAPGGQSFGVNVPSMHPDKNNFYGLMCMSWFEVNGFGMIVQVKHEGSNCLREEALVSY